MPRGVIDISILGDKQLQRAFNRLPAKEAPKILRKACRASAKRLKPLIVARTPVDTGKLKAAMMGAKIRSAARKRGEIKYGVVMPTREKLGISPSAKGYYPYALEYGTKTRAAQPWIRATVNAHTEEEHRQIGRDLGKYMEAFWRKATKR